MSESPTRRDQRLHQFHPESRFGGFTDIDGHITFYARVRELLPSDGVALDIGCGRGEAAEDPIAIRRELRTLRGHCERVIGIDVDPVGESNPTIDEFRMISDTARWPLDDASVDLAVADFVLEHVADPPSFFAEAARVLKPGATLCLRTVNTRSYLGIASRLVPTGAHGKLLGRMTPERKGEDVFPTVYRCNTRPALRRALAEHGFDAAVYGTDSEPSYLAFSAPTYALGLLYRRLMPGGLRLGLVAFAERR
jgi:ubiquinone/menaquinone biosynthesis C-methylase UbiE